MPFCSISADVVYLLAFAYLLALIACFCLGPLCSCNTSREHFRQHNSHDWPYSQFQLHIQLLVHSCFVVAAYCFHCLLLLLHTTVTAHCCSCILVQLHCWICILYHWLECFVFLHLHVSSRCISRLVTLHVSLRCMVLAPACLIARILTLHVLLHFNGL